MTSKLALLILPLHAPSARAAVIAFLVLACGAAPAAALCGDPPGAFARGPARPSGTRVLVLTFDAAWSADGAGDVLDVLGAAGVRATFFLAGRFVSEHPEIARRIAEEGHEAGNHTFHHDHLTLPGGDQGLRRTLPGFTQSRLAGEMDDARRIFERATGRSLAPLWRAPYGEINAEILSWGAAAGYRHVGWSAGFDALDWVSDRSSRLYHPPAAAVASLLRRLAARRPGEGPAVVLMHLGSTRPRGERFVEVLPLLIEGARRLGYRFRGAGEVAAEGLLP